MDQRKDTTVEFLKLMGDAIAHRKFANLAKCDEAHDDHIRTAQNYERYAGQVASRDAVTAYLDEHAPEPEYLKARFPAMF